MTGIKLIIFDIDGTLYTSREYERHLLESSLDIIARRLRISLDDAFNKLIDVKKNAMTVSRSVEILGIPRKEFYDELANKVEPEKFIGPNHELLKAIRILRGKGFKVVLHTNAGSKLARKVLLALGIELEEFDLLVSSDDCEPKPSPSGYRMIIDRFGVKPEEVLYIGDRYLVEVKPAKDLGMKTMLVGEEEYRGMVDYFVLKLAEAINILNTEA